MATPCALCGSFHDTPRQSKNCERRVRKYSQSPPKAPKCEAPSIEKFNESDIVDAYFRWKSSLEEDSV